MNDNIKAEKEKYMQWYRNFKKTSESEKDNWNLARSRNEKLNQLIISIQNEFKILDDRVENGKTYCLIFDSKKKYSDTITDGLIGENVTTKVDTEQEYYVKGDKTAKFCQVTEKKMKNSDEISKIIVPSTNWPSLETLRLTLSPNTYTKFLQQCHEKKYSVDALVVAINSVNDFNNEDIKQLLKGIPDHYPDPFILLNDAPDTDCTMLADCDICYEDKRKFLSKLKLTDERFLKVSAKCIIQKQDPKQISNFESFKKLLEEDVTMEKVAGRFFKKSKILLQSFQDIQKFILEDRSNINNDTNNYQMKLKNNNEKTNKTINESKCQIKTKLENVIKNIQYTDNINKDINKNNIEPVIDQQMDEFGKDMRKEIFKLMNSQNPEFENYIIDMCLKDYINPDKYGMKLKKAINDLQITTANENNNQSRFLSSIKRFIDDTFVSIKSEFERFVRQFKDKILEKYKRFEKIIKEHRDQYIALNTLDGILYWIVKGAIAGAEGGSQVPIIGKYVGGFVGGIWGGIYGLTK